VLLVFRSQQLLYFQLQFVDVLAQDEL